MRSLLKAIWHFNYFQLCPEISSQNRSFGFIIIQTQFIVQNVQNIILTLPTFSQIFGDVIDDSQIKHKQDFLLCIALDMI